MDRWAQWNVVFVKDPRFYEAKSSNPEGSIYIHTEFWDLWSWIPEFPTTAECSYHLRILNRSLKIGQKGFVFEFVHFKFTFFKVCLKGLVTPSIFRSPQYLVSMTMRMKGK